MAEMIRQAEEAVAAMTPEELRELDPDEAECSRAQEEQLAALLKAHEEASK